MVIQLPCVAPKEIWMKEKRMDEERKHMQRMNAMCLNWNEILMSSARRSADWFEIGWNGTNHRHRHLQYLQWYLQNCTLHCIYFSQPLLLVPLQPTFSASVLLILNNSIKSHRAKIGDRFLFVLRDGDSNEYSRKVENQRPEWYILSFDSSR